MAVLKSISAQLFILNSKNNSRTFFGRVCINNFIDEIFNKNILRATGERFWRCKDFPTKSGGIKSPKLECGDFSLAMRILKNTGMYFLIKKYIGLLWMKVF